MTFTQLTDALPDDVNDRVTELDNYVWATWIDSQCMVGIPVVRAH